jgi:hypothetical protein
MQLSASVHDESPVHVSHAEVHSASMHDSHAGKALNVGIAQVAGGLGIELPLGCPVPDEPPADAPEPPEVPEGWEPPDIPEAPLPPVVAPDASGDRPLEVPEGWEPLDVPEGSPPLVAPADSIEPVGGGPPQARPSAATNSPAAPMIPLPWPRFVHMPASNSVSAADAVTTDVAR